MYGVKYLKIACIYIYTRSVPASVPASVPENKNYGFHPLKKNSNDYIDCTNNNFV